MQLLFQRQRSERVSPKLSSTSLATIHSLECDYSCSTAVKKICVNCIVFCLNQSFKTVISSQVKPRTARQMQQHHLPSVLHLPPTHVLHPLLSLCLLSRNAGRPSRSPQARTIAKCICQLHRYPHLPHKWRVNPFSFHLARPQNPLSLLRQPHQLVPLRASNCSPLPPNQVKAMPSLCPHLDEPKIPKSPKRDHPFLLRPPLSNPLENGVQAKTPPNLLALLSWCAALCRTCHWTMPLCAEWPSRKPLLHLLSTNGPEAGRGRPACLLLPVTHSERKMMRKKVSRG